MSRSHTQNKSRRARRKLRRQYDDATQGKSLQEHRRQKNPRSTDSDSFAAGVRGAEELSQALFGNALPNGAPKPLNH